jgi:uncharacterized protein (DUF2237 family)
MKQVLFLILILGISCTGRDAEKNPINSSPWKQDKNIYLKGLQLCSLEPMTGFLRNGYCQTNQNDEGVHTVCAVITEDFLEFTLGMGNDLVTAKPDGFPGLKPGDRWCICADWWKAAAFEGLAPPVKLEATHRKSLLFIDLEALESFDENQKKNK